jgi:aldehyde dehydrogenase (NAD+)
LLKPSEVSQKCSELLAELVPQYLDTSAIRLVTGGPSESTYLLSLRFDQIFFTGSSKIARFITAAAAKHLTPVVLELGGQGPTIVTKTADIDLAARRITWAKFMNAGQICLSVNHVFADPEIADKLVERLGYWNDQYLSQGNEYMCRIVNDRNFERLTDLLDRSNGKSVYGGQRIPAERYIAPTVVDHVTLDDSLLSEELFGPILPVVRMSAKDAVNAINSMPSPLALYIFSGDKHQTDWIIDSTISGGVTVNNVMIHAAVPNAPFGGVGEAGYGAYHGPHGIDCFSHRRVVVQPPKWLDKLMGFTYPPYSMKSLKWLVVKNSLGFKRGETLEDQRRSRRGLARFIRWAVLGGLISSVAYYLQHQRGV